MKYKANPVIVDAFKIVDVGTFYNPSNLPHLWIIYSTVGI